MNDIIYGTAEDLLLDDAVDEYEYIEEDILNYDGSDIDLVGGITDDNEDSFLDYDIDDEDDEDEEDSYYDDNTIEYEIGNDEEDDDDDIDDIEDDEDDDDDLDEYYD